MSRMEEFDARISGGGDDAVAAVRELCETREKILFDITDAFTKARWIPVSERLPDDDVEVLAWLPCDERACAGCVHDGYWNSPDIRLNDHPTSGDDECPTHWMPLPEPPEVK